MKILLLYLLLVLLNAISVAERNEGQVGKQSCQISGNEQKKPLKVLVSTSTAFLPVLLNWLIFYFHICPTEVSSLYLLCLDKELEVILPNYGLSCTKTFVLPSGKGAHNRLWAIRNQLTYELLYNNTHVLLSDSDALWLRSPFPSLSKHFNDSDVIASRAKFPEDIARRFGATLCMGFILVKSSPGSIILWKQLAESLIRTKSADDQRTINDIFMRNDISFPDRLKFYRNTVPETGVLKLQKGKQILNITLLPQHQFRRHCDPNFPEAVINTTIAHCTTYQRSDTMKKKAMGRFDLWLLRNNWKEQKISSNQTIDQFFQTLSKERRKDTLDTAAPP